MVGPRGMASLAAALLVSLAAGLPARADVPVAGGFAEPGGLPGPSAVMTLGEPAWGASPLALAKAPFYQSDAPAPPPASGARPRIGLGADRARILLRSLTLPGWGQASLGRRTSATVFGLIETGVWASFVSFRVQESLRRRAYETTAEIFAGIDLSGRDESYRRIVGIYPSSDEYNRLVVYRDAANRYYDDPDSMRIYIAEHELKGGDAWAWDGPESFERYQEQRKQTRRAAQRANAMLGVAIANRLVSAIHAARHAGRPAPEPRSWRFELGPAPGDPLALRMGVRVRYP